MTEPQPAVSRPRPGEQPARPATHPAGVLAFAAWFEDGDDYLTELAHDTELIERRIVRVKLTSRPDPEGQDAELFLQAQAIVDGRLVQLRQRCGTLTGFDVDQPVRDRARADRAWLREQLESLGLDVRAGAWTLQAPTRGAGA